MGVVVEVARRGSTLEGGADKDRVFSSKFPSLPIAFKLKITWTYTGTGGTLVTLFNHNLKFKPVFYAEIDGGYEDTSTFPFPAADGKFKMGPHYTLMVDESRLLAERPGATGTMVMYVTIYLRDLEEEFFSDAVTPFERKAGSIANPAVFKIARPGYTVEDTDDRHLVINTDRKFLPLHRTGFIERASSGSTVNEEVIHNLGYQPYFWLFLAPQTGSSTDNYYRFLIGLWQADAGPGSHYVDKESLYIATTAKGKYAYVIFKDPIAS